MIFHSILFSVNSAKENCYVYMLMMLLHSLLKTKSLQDTDTYVIMVNADVSNLLQSIELFRRPNIKIIVMPDPKTLIDGMAWRYQLHRMMDIIGQTVCYLDVDMLCVRPMKVDIPDDVEGAILVCPEGANDDTNYSASEHPLRLPCGVTSGFFIYKCNHLVLQLMEETYYNIRTHSVQYYTLDQPHFNKALQDKPFVNYMNPKTLSFNGHNIDPSDPPVFINCCGDPGSGHFHLLKMLQFFIAAH